MRGAAISLVCEIPSGDSYYSSYLSSLLVWAMGTALFPRSAGVGGAADICITSMSRLFGICREVLRASPR